MSTISVDKMNFVGRDHDRRGRLIVYTTTSSLQRRHGEILKKLQPFVGVCINAGDGLDRPRTRLRDQRRSLWRITHRPRSPGRPQRRPPLSCKRRAIGFAHAGRARESTERTILFREWSGHRQRVEGGELDRSKGIASADRRPFFWPFYQNGNRGLLSFESLNQEARLPDLRANALNLGSRLKRSANPRNELPTPDPHSGECG